MLEKLHTITATMVTDYLAIQAERVKQLENGVEHSQLVLVSILLVSEASIPGIYPP